MVVYMLRKIDSDLYYKTGTRCCTMFVKQSEAKVWTTRQGVIGAKTLAAKRGFKCYIVMFELKELASAPTFIELYDKLESDND